MTVDGLIQKLQALSAEGKGDYEVFCEGFCVEASEISVADSRKEISLQ